MKFTEDDRKALLKKMFPAESWDVNEAAEYNADEKKWEFTTPLGKDCIYQVIRSENPKEQILNVEVVSAGLCYERASDNCHRHLVARWLRDNGIECVEYSV